LRETLERRVWGDTRHSPSQSCRSAMSRERSTNIDAFFNRSSSRIQNSRPGCGGRGAFFGRKVSGKNARFGSISCKKASIFARIPTFSPRFNRQVAPRAGAKRAPRTSRSCVNDLPKTLIKSYG
jgi:hypothetical protein